MSNPSSKQKLDFMKTNKKCMDYIINDSCDVVYVDQTAIQVFENIETISKTDE